MQKAILFFFLFSSIIGLSAQSNNSKINLFIDCQMRCDFTYVKQEVRFVNYMNNRDEADVYVLATTQQLGSGGREIQLSFLGNNGYEGINDTIKYTQIPESTQAVQRELFVKNLKKGLLAYILNSSLAANISYDVKVPKVDIADKKTEDPWNYWVFNVGGNANLSGESSFQKSSIRGRFSSSRVTDQSKFRYFFNYSYQEEIFKLTDGEEFSSIIKRFSNFFYYVHSINEHWSAAFRSGLGSSTFGNTDFDGSLKPAVEYNIYPYEDASTRRFSFQYALGPEYKDYTDITIYDKLRETVVRHNFDIEFEQIKKWGSIEVDLRAGQYLHDLDLWSLSINPNLDWVIYKGLSIDLGGYSSYVADRINIAKSDITDEDILLQIKQLNTNFTYYTYLGINYRFGSRFNNFVNPRF